MGSPLFLFLIYKIGNSKASLLKSYYTFVEESLCVQYYIQSIKIDKKSLLIHL